MSDTDRIHERLVDDLREMLETFAPDGDTDEDMFFAYMIAGAIGRAVTIEEPDLGVEAFGRRFFTVLSEFLDVYHASCASEPSDPDKFKLTASDSLVKLDDGTAAVIVGGERADLPPEVADMVNRLKLDLSECMTADGAKDVLISHGARQDEGGSDDAG